MEAQEADRATVVEVAGNLMADDVSLKSHGAVNVLIQVKQPAWL